VNDSARQALQESQALRNRLAFSLRSSQMGLTAVGRINPAEQRLIEQELALVEQAKALLLKPARGLS
jgi:hypothetical protein